MTKDKSYMELCLHVDGGENLYLRVPTVWNAVDKTWIGFIKTPKTQRLIHAEGKTSFDLQNSFNIEVSKVFKEGGQLAEEIFAMFMPAFYWEK
jgi:hypothetical protein